MSNLVKFDTNMTITSGDMLFYTMNKADMQAFKLNDHTESFFTFDLLTGEIRTIPFPDDMIHIDSAKFKKACHADFCYLMKCRIDDIIVQLPMSEIAKALYADNVKCLQSRYGALKAYYDAYAKTSNNNTVRALTSVLSKDGTPTAFAEYEKKTIESIKAIVASIEIEKGVSDAIKKCKGVLTDYARFIWQPDNTYGIDAYVFNINSTSAASVWSKTFPKLKIDKTGIIGAKAPNANAFTSELILTMFQQLQTAKTSEGKLTVK